MECGIHTHTENCRAEGLMLLERSLGQAVNTIVMEWKKGGTGCFDCNYLAVIDSPPLRGILW